MKKLLFTFCLCLFAILCLDAQTNIFPSSGNVGIGITSPSVELEIKGGDGVGISLNNELANSWDIINSQYGKLDFVRGKTSVLMRINQHGHVGIGTTDPKTLLNVYVGSGSVNSEAAVRIGGLNNYASLELGIEGDYDGMIRSFGNNLKYYAGHWRTIGTVATEDHSHNWYTSKAGSTDWSNVKMILNQNGDLGLGTVSPDARLTVKGNIHTNEVKVDLLGAVAPDYVFHKDYDLKSLKTVKEYIAINGHLPNIPSAKDMETDGIMLKEMNLKLLEKIEELTLYAIEQNKKIETQEARLQKLEAHLNSKNNK